MRKRILAALAALLVTVSLADGAVAAAGGGAGITGKVGTLGFGGELTAGIAPRVLNVRVGANYLDWEPDITDDGNRVDLDMNFQSFSALLDLHPFRGGFRVSAGMFLNNNEFNISADVDDPVSINDIDFRVSDIGGTISFDEYAPYVGIGYGNALSGDGRWNFVFDLGVLMQGSPQITMHATASDPRVQPVLDRAIVEEVKELEDDTEDYKYYPVLAIGISYRF